MQRKEVFLREATGLVRDISLFDYFSYNSGSFGIALAVSGFNWTIAFFSGADPLISFALMVLATIPLILMYCLFAATMPRAGGDYIYTSRTLSPFLGWVGSWAVWFMQALWLGINSAWVANFYMPAFVGSVGNLNLAAMLATPEFTFVIGSIVICGIGATMVFSKKIHFLFNNILFVIAIVGSIACVVVALGATRPQAIQALNQYMGSYTGSADTYHLILERAQGLGFAIAPVTLFATIAAMTEFWGPTVGSLFSTYSTGEFKGAGKVRRQIIVTLGPLLFLWVISSLIYVGTTNAFGADLISSAFWLNSNYPQEIVFPFPAYIFFFATILAPEALRYLIGLSFVASGILMSGILFMMTTRTFFAWSFDRLAPSMFADVSERFHTPIKGTLLTIAAAEISLIVCALISPLWGTYLFMGLMMMETITTYVFASIAGAVFPFRRRKMYEASPAKRWEIGRIPLMTVLAILALFCCLLVGFEYLYFPEYGVNTTPVLSVSLGIIVIGIILYPIIRAVRTRQGIDLDLVFKEIPPE